MLAILIVCAMIGILTYYQVFQQGFFSALIMAVLSLVSALVALNYFEVLAEQLAQVGLGSFAPQAICLMGVFAICLYGLREATDRLIRGNMNFPLVVDRVGAAFCGLIVSLTITGMVALGFQVLPTPAKLLYFDRYPDLTQPEESKTLFPGPDGFVVSVMSSASNHCFAGRRGFSQIHPDFLQELYMNRLVLDSGSRREAAPDALKLEGARVVEEYLRDTSGVMLESGPGEVLISVKVSIKTGTDSKENRGARDVDGMIRCTMGNFRLVGYNPSEGGRDETGLVRYPLGVMQGETAERLGLDGGKTFSAGAMVELLFNWPGDMKEVAPQFLEFKRSSRVLMPKLSAL